MAFACSSDMPSSFCICAILSISSLGDDTVAQGGDDLRLEDILPARDLVGEGRGDDTCEKGDNTDAHDRRDRAYQLADRRDRRDIAITDCGEGDQRPPHGRRYRREILRLGLMLDYIHQRAGSEQRYEEQVHGGAEGTFFRPDGGDQILQRAE